LNRITQLVLALLAVCVLIGASLLIEISFPYMEHSSNIMESPNVPDTSYDEITTGVSQFLWDYRSLDLVSQSFVVTVAVICCLAMLKSERRSE
jgi:hypothetical protein